MTSPIDPNAADTRPRNDASTRWPLCLPDSVTIKNTFEDGTFACILPAGARECVKGTSGDVSERARNTLNEYAHDTLVLSTIENPCLTQRLGQRAVLMACPRLKCHAKAALGRTSWRCVALSRLRVALSPLRSNRCQHCSACRLRAQWVLSQSWTRIGAAAVLT